MKAQASPHSSFIIPHSSFPVRPPSRSGFRPAYLNQVLAGARHGGERLAVEIARAEVTGLENHRQVKPAERVTERHARLDVAPHAQRAKSEASAHRARSLPARDDEAARGLI